MTNLKFHPLADIFPLMEGEEFAALVADIKANGVSNIVTLYQGMILDGRNRYRACKALGWTDRRVQLELPMRHSDAFVDDHGGPLAYVISANIHRRHLTAQQKRELIAKLIKAQPEKSDRQLGRMIKADHKTIGAIRAQKEATGEISPVEKRVGKDGKARKLPTKKPSKRQLKHERQEQDRARSEVRRKENEARAKTAIWKLLQLDPVLAREIHSLMHTGAFLVMDALDAALAGGNGADPTATAEAIKAKFAKLDDGLDIPESLRRDRVQP
jgi:ParB-like chromosome segregation protein Spo0J